MGQIHTHYILAKKDLAGVSDSGMLTAKHTKDCLCSKRVANTHLNEQTADQVIH